jgi:pyruvate dehydrogenase E1 component alpha subunit
MRDGERWEEEDCELAVAPLEGRKVGKDGLPDGFWLESGYYMHLIREVEATAARWYRQGKLPGSAYDGLGQEGGAIGTGLALERRDLGFPLLRDMGVHLVRGVKPMAMLAHYLGRLGGPMVGRDGNVHFGSPPHGTYPTTSHLPDMAVVAVGWALGQKMKGTDRLAVAWFGDGAASTGAHHEALIGGGVWKVPVVFVCENNGWAYSTPNRLQFAGPDIASRAEAAGWTAWRVDGNKVDEVWRATREALDHARRGEGPAFMELKTFRVHGHAAHDPASYVPAEEREGWLKRDPIEYWRQAAGKAGHKEAELDEVEQRAKQEVAEAAEEALQQPYPDPGTIREGVYATAIEGLD